jgi:amino acid transporter
MTHRTQPATAITPPPATKLEPDAIGLAQDTVIGMAESAPTVTIGLTLASLAAVAAYGTGPVLLLTAIPMLIIANGYRRLNLWNANCGASFEWVGRSINPYLGFMTGWLMIAAYIIGAVSTVVVMGPTVLAIFNANTSSAEANVAIACGIALVMLVIAIVGIRITARTQVGIAIVEYVIFLAIAIAGLLAVLHHHPGTFPITRGWFSLSGIGGRGNLVAGLLISVYIYAGWEGTLYVNEEVKHRHRNPGRAAIIAVILLTVIYIVSMVGLQGVVSPARLQAHSTTALVYAAQALGGASWARAMAFALALSVIACTLTGIVLGARIVYGMASHRTLPVFLANVSPRFRTPVGASLVVGLLVIVLTAVYLLATSVQDAFSAVVAVDGLLFASFYILTAVATIVYYRRRCFSNAWDSIVLGILPLASAIFLTWIVVKSVAAAPASEKWSIVGIVVAGLVLMLAARFVLRSSFFQTPRERDPGRSSSHRA